MVIFNSQIHRSGCTRLASRTFVLGKREVLHQKISTKRTYLISYASETPSDKPLDSDLNDFTPINAENQQQQKQPARIPTTTRPIVSGSILFYSCMTLFATVVGSLGKLEVYQRLKEPVNFLDAFLWLCPLLLALTIAIKFNDTFKPLQELKTLFQDIFIPQFKSIPIWGFIILAAGAGIGEEALFRGLLQTSMSWKLLDTIGGSSSVNGLLADAISVTLTSLLFGLVHAVSQTYFFYATFASVIFGVECLVSGLSTAVVTHAVYDAVALACIMVYWGKNSSSTKNGE